MVTETAFSSLAMRTFSSPGIGLVLKVPESWIGSSDPKVFQVSDPDSGIQISASAYESPGIGLEQWADFRFGAVAGTLSGLMLIEKPHAFAIGGKSGLAVRYEGKFPERDYESGYLVVCVVVGKALISLTVTGKKEAFAANEPLFRWLLETQMEIAPKQSGC